MTSNTIEMLTTRQGYALSRWRKARIDYEDGRSSEEEYFGALEAKRDATRALAEATSRKSEAA